MPVTYDPIKRRDYKLIRSGMKAPSSKWVDIECPFCGTVARAYIWSLSGGGKCCPGNKCGAKHNAYGSTTPRKKDQ